MPLMGSNLLGEALMAVREELRLRSSAVGAAASRRAASPMMPMMINGFGPSFGECFLDLPAPDELSVESVGEPPKREGSTFIFMN